ncbi:Peroxisome proliferator-activated receptor gamma coactivator 1-alpha, partial [Ophiophagus hannah]
MEERNEDKKKEGWKEERREGRKNQRKKGKDRMEERRRDRKKANIQLNYNECSGLGTRNHANSNHRIRTNPALAKQLSYDQKHIPRIPFSRLYSQLPEPAGEACFLQPVKVLSLENVIYDTPWEEEGKTGS